jgi:hypothetical protein
MVQDQIWPHWLCQLWAKRDERRGKKTKEDSFVIAPKTFYSLVGI